MEFHYFLRLVKALETDLFCLSLSLKLSIFNSSIHSNYFSIQFILVFCSDMLSDSSALSLQKSITLSGTVEMDPLDFDALLKVIRIEPMLEEEPRLANILEDVNFANLYRFLLHYYEGERRCRYFVRNQYTVRRSFSL